ncbi:hypothetical protein PENSTE_c006G02394 [Penicillium steckii]|uniref:Dickkopf N-terminal cysteine-rich domain-containing protein n=1 Tax=Penicillium steckii TaxID=303698 RepID=A0A1V6THV0_9EURO|nr:hypothetical protein PENSTE_c006G02394 [Penicillium steckii]
MRVSSMMAVATMLANAALPMAQRTQVCGSDVQCNYNCDDGYQHCNWGLIPGPNRKSGKCGLNKKSGRRECYLPCNSNSECGFREYCDTSNNKCTFKDSDGAKCSEDNTCKSGFCLNGECSTTADKKSCANTEECIGLGASNRVCSPDTHTCLESGIKPGGQCKITDQCDQKGYAFNVCCQSGQCQTCTGTTGAVCSDDSGCNSGLKCLQREERFSRKICTPTDGSEYSVCSKDGDCKDGRACYKGENDSRELCNNKNGSFNSPCDKKSGKEGDGCLRPFTCYDGKCQQSGQNCLRRNSGCLFRPNSCCEGLECKSSYSDLETICRPK